MLITPSAGKFLKRNNIIHLGDKQLDLTIPVVAGIINITPDSFYDGSRMDDETTVLKAVGQMIADGASIIDVGAVSTRPGADSVSTKEELNRLLPIVKAIRTNFPDIVMSIDTFRSWVAVRVVDEIGSVIINDISGGMLDPKMFETVGKLQMPYILSHIKGTPRDMQEEPQYDNLMQEISSYFSEKVKKLTKLGVKDIILDPGFGFGKTLDNNYELLNKLDAFKVFQLPVMVGMSRKSMIWKALGEKPETALNGTTVANTLALMGGADLLRVHDVKEAVEAVKIFCEVKVTIK